MNSGQIDQFPSVGKLLLLTGSACAVAFLYIVGAVLPAEFNRDPLGIGKATGLSDLYSPGPEQLVIEEGSVGYLPESTTPYAQHSFTIELAPNGDAHLPSSLEFKLELNSGSAMVYSWQVNGLTDPTRLFAEFHGETYDASGNLIVGHYGEDRTLQDAGVLVAPFDGVHGWYWRNDAETAVTIELTTAGFYRLVPAGNMGNEAGIAPN